MNKKAIIYSAIGVLCFSSIMAFVLFKDKIMPASDTKSASTSEAAANLENSTTSQKSTTSDEKSTSGVAQEKAETKTTEKTESTTKTTETQKEISVEEANAILEEKFGKGKDKDTGNQLLYFFVKKVFDKKSHKPYYYFMNSWQTEAGNVSFLQTIFISTDGKEIHTSSEPNIEEKLSNGDILDVEAVSET